MFTDRFMKVPVEMYNRKEAEITGDSDSSSFVAVGTINPFDISHYVPAFDNEGNEENKTTLYFKCGESILICLSVCDFEKRLNEFVK